MKMRPITVSHEYLDTLCDRMLEWAVEEDAYTFPQFLEKQGLGYSYFKYFCYANDKVHNTAELVKAALHNKWMKLAMSKKDLAPHQRKILMTYIRNYDSQLLDTERELKEAAAEAEARTQMKITAENYANEELQQPYRQFYEENDNKRRGGDEA